MHYKSWARYNFGAIAKSISCQLSFQIVFDISECPESRLNLSNHCVRLLVSSQPAYTELVK